ncbi:hypothetical protein ASPFODRAFT_674798 [Aspergillus luchuensis CBS 106.47]|uniref:Uncharacterized protein n=1 Tax=Aspergillus luchuensis (strain CBS 106.47) TaxID=1137211 RepID=A0A1M3TC69_ASPLC|nr:hypothetical protein ASPFODRAFT_674798 [Aspergillus luchuensis CBS 106.47]
MPLRVIVLLSIVVIIIVVQQNALIIKTPSKRNHHHLYDVYPLYTVLCICDRQKRLIIEFFFSYSKYSRRTFPTDQRSKLFGYYYPAGRQRDKTNWFRGWRSSFSFKTVGWGVGLCHERQ